MKNLWIALLLLIWLILGWLFHQKHSQCCHLASTPTHINETIISGPLLFKLGSHDPIIGTSWNQLRDSILSLVSANNVLEIIGKYCINSLPPESDSLGWERAHEIRKLFPTLPDDKVSLSSKGMECDTSITDKNMDLYGISTKIRTENIKEIDDKTLIYFPPNSTEKLNSSEVESYLMDVAKRVISSGEMITLIGHTDDVGPADKNMILAQKRADIIKKYLVSQGVSNENISSTSEGELRPMEDNSTKEGRSKNRRTELQIFKSLNQN